MNDDATLLRRYAEEGSQAAFGELVRRHVDLVYGAALRRTGGDVHRAADVAQQVFTTLARAARKLAHHTVLGAWLHTATRNAALNLMISEGRRKVRETEALAFDTRLAAGVEAPDWDQVRPVLDAAIDELPETDRAAVVLRFLERRAFAEIGAALQVSEDAARMRTDRALDKLRAVLARRGITSTAAALGAIVSSQPLVSAPADLAASLASASLVAAHVGFFASTLASLMTTKIITTAALSALLAFGAGAYVGLSHGLDAPLPALETPRQSQMIASLRQDNQNLKTEIDRLKADVDRLNAANAQRVAQSGAVSTPKNVGALMPAAQQQQAMLNNLRQLAAAIDQFRFERGRDAASLDELVGTDKYIRRLLAVNGEDYSRLSLQSGQPLAVTTLEGMTVSYDPALGRLMGVSSATARRANDLGRKIEPAAKKALDAYRAANQGSAPKDESALIPYFSSPKDGADFVDFMELKKAVK